MSKASDAELIKFLNTPVEEMADAVGDIRNGLRAIGAKFDGVCWIETQKVIDKALAPYRAEIKRLRSLPRSGASRGEGKP